MIQSKYTDLLSVSHLDILAGVDQRKTPPVAVICSIMNQ